MIEKVLRINPDIVLYNDFIRVQETAKEIEKIMKEYTNKGIKSQHRDFTSSDSLDEYIKLLKQHNGKRILIVGNKGTLSKSRFFSLRSLLYKVPQDQVPIIKPLEIIELPVYILKNDLDKRILAELHKTMKEIDTHLQNYVLDEATKSATDFMDKLTNRRLRRSRRRFRSNGMNDDKYAAYATLYRVLKRYLQILAPFTPFITEHLRLELANFTNQESSETSKKLQQSSIHLSHRPIASNHYINQPLIEEITTVRKIIKMALFIRAKNKIAVKQPLQKLKIKID